MKKKFLGIICILYICLIIYTIIFDKLKNYLAPNMQTYLIVSLIPLLILGLVMIFSKNKYKFKISDIILLLPIIMIILSGDGRLTSSFARNRVMENPHNKQVVTRIGDLEENSNEIDTSKGNVNNEQNNTKVEKIDFEVVDENYNELANYLTFDLDSKRFEGNTVKVKGFISNDNPLIPSGYLALGRYVITCCAADASFVGFIIKTTRNIDYDSWYEITGILKSGKDSDGYDIMYIDVTNINQIDGMKEEQYVYPCYSYDDGTCKEVKKYGLNY